jgi:hypothetical protein
MSFPIDENHMVLVSTEPFLDHAKIIKGVLDLIKNG